MPKRGYKMIKDILIEMKLTTEQIDKTMSMLDINYVQLSKFDEVNQELKKVRYPLLK